MPLLSPQIYRQAFSRLASRKTFAASAILTLALAAAVFTTVLGGARALRRQLVPSLPLTDIDTLDVANTATGWQAFGLPASEYERIAPDLSDGGIETANFGTAEVLEVAANGASEMTGVQPVSGDYASVLRLEAQVGRWIEPLDDEGHGRTVAVISARLWREWFRDDPGVVSTGAISINGVRFQIVGVAPGGFAGLAPDLTRTEVWIPHASLPAMFPLREHRWFESRWITLLFRRQAIDRADLQARVTRLLSTGMLRRDRAHIRAQVVPATRLFADADRLLALVMLVALLMLGAACANAANLFQVRVNELRTDLAVRRALGAAPAQLAAVVLSEALVIGAIAAGIAAAAALAAARTFDVTFPTVAVGRQHFASLSIAPDWWTLTIAVFVTLVTAGGAAAIAALRAVGWGDARGDVRGASSPHDHGQRRLRTVLVSVQVTVALLMLMGTGLLLQNAPESLSRAIHFDAGHLHAAGASLRLYGYDADRAQRFYSRMLDGLRGVAGVQDVAVASAIPGATDRASPETVWLVAGLRNDLVGSTRRITAAAVAISPGFLEVAGIPLEHGRAFTQADGDGAARTAILSRSAADVLFPGRDPIGLPLSYGFEGPSMTIVGVVADPVSGPSHEAPFAQPANMIFVPFAQHPAVDAFVVMRMPAGQAATDAVRAVTRAVDDRVGLDGPWSVQERFLAGLAPMRALRLILLSAAAVAVGIALLGVYGVLACFVEVRIREFGIRLALGAAPAQVVRLVFDHTMHVLLIGLLSGVFAATAAARLLEHTLVALMPNEILTWALAPTALLLAGLVAGCIPAIRAARVDPAVTLRHG